MQVFHIGLHMNWGDLTHGTDLQAVQPDVLPATDPALVGFIVAV